MNDLMIRVFPNSGHQYENILLSEILPDWEDQDIRTFASNNETEWKSWDAFTPWVRYRYEDRPSEQGGPVLRLAIETNLGSSSNGLLFDTEEISSKDEFRETDTPYASYDEANIEEDFGRNRCIPLTYLPNSDEREIEVSITIHWIRSTGSDPVEVDLVVDLGNTRTVALLLEQPSHEPIPFGRRVQPVRFMPPGESFEVQKFNGSGISFDDLSIIDSWFVLKRSNFAEMEPPYGEEKVLRVQKEEAIENEGSSRRKILKFVANTFVEMSPALIGGGDFEGGARNALSEAPLDEDARFTMGSPKRYAWDDRSVGMAGSNYWSQMPNINGKNKHRPFYFEKLDGLFRLFMDPEGQDWKTSGAPRESDLENAPFRNSPPNFPRRDSICWFALSILEASYRQINSSNYLNVAKRRTLPRKLSKVSVLYPSGWTKLEKDAYFNQWKRALDIFNTTHLTGGNGKVRLGTNTSIEFPSFEERGLDEAMCAQLPVVYSEVCSLGGAGKAWFNLYGNGKKVRVMNVDIGGGTTDFSVIEYRSDSLRGEVNETVKTNDPTARLKAKLLYKDGKTVAGDALVKKIIEDILIPNWVGASLGDIDCLTKLEKEWLGKMFSEPESILFSDVDARLPQKLSRVARLVFIPIINRVLTFLGRDQTTHKTQNFFSLKVDSVANKKILGELNEITQATLSQKIHDYENSEQSFFSADVELSFSISEINELIDEVFVGLFDDLLQVFREFPCDLVILSGKPSELVRIKEKTRDTLPIMPQRIIDLKGYEAGNWYPFAEMGKVTDAKTAAVVGAALHQDILNGNLTGFSLKEEIHLDRTPHYWSGINQNARPEEFFRNLIFDKRQLDGNKESFAECEMPIGSVLGRKSSKHAQSNPEPVYQLYYENDTNEESLPANVRVKLKWSMDDQSGEHLELVHVSENKSFPAFKTKNVSLKLQTQMNETHWLDSPRLNVSKLLNS